MDNFRSMGFKMHIGSTTPLEKLKVLYRALISQVRNQVYILIADQTCICFSQMNNFRVDVLPKYLCAKTTNGRLASKCFLGTPFFTTPIILDVFYIPRGFLSCLDR